MAFQSAYPLQMCSGKKDRVRLTTGLESPQFRESKNAFTLFPVYRWLQDTSLN